VDLQGQDSADDLEVRRLRRNCRDDPASSAFSAPRWASPLALFRDGLLPQLLGHSIAEWRTATEQWRTAIEEWRRTQASDLCIRDARRAVTSRGASSTSNRALLLRWSAVARQEALIADPCSHTTAAAESFDGSTGSRIRRQTSCQRCTCRLLARCVPPSIPSSNDSWRSAHASCASRGVRRLGRAINTNGAAPSSEPHVDEAVASGRTFGPNIRSYLATDAGARCATAHARGVTPALGARITTRAPSRIFLEFSERIRSKSAHQFGVVTTRSRPRTAPRKSGLSR
jgi:hypothetical protein